ncbi:hypothetical protein H8M03_01920 [Sphingomonas sabuli]|uniref:O-antigen ligase domain-containing protein n=1 Tax=Sphingomonas sabuli TaxID=2764186 RepID=A0A7G9L3E3_9SPHN|nr:hypothetical protein [Sphingomonas sabuli]QNM83142.1 hypothetical protein H8M03_01920 [Sphingomonas sabuli]
MEAVLLGLGLALLPVYTFESGSVQFSHIILTLFIAIRFSYRNHTLTKASIFLILLTILSFTVESLAVIIGAASYASFLEPTYLLYNSMILIAFSHIPLDQKRFRVAIITSLIVAASIAAVYGLAYGSVQRVSGGGYERTGGAFNNPNQLGFFGVCVASIAALMYMRDLISRKLCVLMWVMSLLIVLISVSRSSAAAIAFLLIFGMGAVLNKKRLSPVVFVAALAGVGTLFVAFQLGLLDQLQSVARLQQTGSSQYDSLSMRGYSIPFHNPLEFMFGVGSEKALVGTFFTRIEVHSTWWSFMGKYGLLGFGLFVAVWLIWSRLIYKELGLLGLLIVVVPASINGITGNYSRFTALWILVGLPLNRSLWAARQATPDDRMLQPRRPFVPPPRYSQGIVPGNG